MKNAFVCLIALFILSVSAFSQDDSKIGVGVSYGVNLIIGINGPVPLINYSMIYVPINFSGFRLEPFIMYFNSSLSSQVEEVTYQTERKLSSFTFGSGFFYLLKANKSVVPYLGLRIGYGSNSSTYKSQYSDTEDSGSLLSVGGILGGEYYFSPNFSLGADVGLVYYNFFTPSEKSAQIDTKYSSYSNSEISTTAAIIARIFF
ncbi:MAG: hypothetical protein A2X61_03500 [Ignavibacteria bacterium GWB2_35_12]|nr:MAG: hypothetical protein A2X63_10175 [Ignavibacteria bacterium GWA2_35_8]OGU42104.1 MAG: hypothetical protein A2X61_03500 [Ignavibacteria bacterium GWB2_35_12]OGU95585.1 MAG: hypothetical protein A2220_06450 [Ignavibacteria bacterium RIFOXYA2_FULL_35_10]OGV20247.1 MAG: hypothetical protein A2475_07845 [Ignavibacteria bacterium RIFOXYC2_FULL_35_21]